MKVLVCGGRDFRDRDYLFDVLDNIDDCNGTAGRISVLITGDARGADALAIEWAQESDCDFEVHYANWDEFGKAAGPIRNQAMLSQQPDLVVAFPGYRGTADMVARAKAAGVEVRCISSE